MGQAPRGLGELEVKITPEVVTAWVEDSCAAQGVPVKVTDPLTVRRVAAILGQDRQSASTRAGSKLPRPRTPGRMVARSSTAPTIER